MSRRQLSLLIGVGFLLAPALVVRASHAPGVDAHTVADEPTYPNVILTDAGPFGYDLRLQSAYGAWWLRLFAFQFR